MALFKVTGKLIGILATLVMLSTIAAVPWMLGGVIPLARFTLLAGAIAAALLSIVAHLLQGRLPRSLPLVAMPLIGLALLGTWQLRTVDSHPISRMHHTVGDLADAVIPDSPAVASLLEADTRTTIATLLALALLAFTSFAHIRTSRSLMWGSLIFIVNGITATTIGLSQLFQNQGLELNQLWALGLNQGSGAAAFATFINPNNAAGWLCLCFACAVGWLSFHMARAGVDGKQQVGRLNIPFWEDAFRRSMQFISDLTTWHILAIVAVAFLGAGIAATQSRGGILALVVGVTIAASIKSSVKRLPAVLLLVTVCGGGVYGLLHWLELDEAIVGEMETLRDLDDAAGTRPQHWLDSAHALLDFPITGTGLGSYRFATLPYRSFTGTTWFRNADNHFMDILIEGGLVGLTLFVSIGAIGLIVGFAGWKEQKTRSVSKSSEAPRISRRLLGAAGSVAVLCTLTQAVSGFFDFGVGMPSASSLLIVIIAACSGLIDSAVSSPSPFRSASMRCHPLFSIAIQIGLIVAAGNFLQDQWATVEIDQSVVDGHRVLMKPFEPSKLDEVASIMQTLGQRLAERPDDAEGMRTMTRLADASFRWQVMLAAKGEAIREDKGFGLLWERSMLHQIMGSLAKMDAADPQTAAGLRAQLTELANENHLAELFESTQKQYPLMPQIAETRCAIAILQNHMELFEQQARHALFVQPANAGIAMTLGTLALQADQHNLAQEFWDHSLKYSEQFRPAMLDNALNHWSMEDAMALFGPRNYTECVEAARNAIDHIQRKEFWNQAEKFWNELPKPQDESTNSLRASHLVATNRMDEAVKWLQQCMKADGDNLLLTRDLARLLEKQQLYKSSLEQWYRIQFLVPGDREADEAINRIRDIK